MSTMPATHGHSEACCNTPPFDPPSKPLKPSDFPDKSMKLDDMDIYVTGPDDASKAIMVIYDIFGYFPQTLKGAEILATGDSTKYKVVMPDWFRGDPCPIEAYPPDNEEKQKTLTAFFGRNSPGSVKAQLAGVVKGVEAKYPSIQSWAIIGYCWGGKVVSLAVSDDDNPFKAAAECHPAMLDPKDGPGIKVPICVLASGDENPKDVKEFEENLQVAKHVETFSDQIHGWMAARSDLSKERVKEEFNRGYKTVLEFFANNW